MEKQGKEFLHWHIQGGILGIKTAQNVGISSFEGSRLRGGSEAFDFPAKGTTKVQRNGLEKLPNSQLAFPGKICSLKNFQGAPGKENEWQRQGKGGRAFPG